MPLSGIKVVDLTRILSGPFCTMILADLGADVIKIETPGKGDPLRTQGEFKDGLSWYYASFNRNKRSVNLNLRTEKGKEILSRLLAEADVVVQNFRPGVMQKMGFGPERLKEINPDLIHCGITGYGVDGPYAGRPAFDFIAQAMSGLMSINGLGDSEPMRVATPISDLIAGTYAAVGVCAALAGRFKRGGGGEEVQTSLLDGLISHMAYMSANYFVSGQLPPRTGNNHPIVAPYGLFKAIDGEVAIAPSNEAIYQRLLEALDLTHLRADPELASNDLRMAHREKINAMVQERISTDTRDNWIARLNAAGVPAGAIQDFNETFSDPQVLHQEMVQEVGQPGHGTIKMTGFPIKLRERPCRLRQPAPRQGEHTKEVLTELGLDPQEIAGLAEEGVC